MSIDKQKHNKKMDDLINSLKPFEALMREIGRKRMKQKDFKVVDLQYKALKEFLKNNKKE